MKVERMIQFALLNNKRVTEALAKTDEGYPLISINHNPEGKYPLIDIRPSQGNDNQHADDKLYTVYSRVDVNFHCANDEYGDVSEEINNTLRRLGFVRVNYYSTRSPYTNITEYTNSYRSTMTQAMINHKFYEEQQQLEVPENCLPDGEYFDDELGRHYELVNGEKIDPNDIWGN